MSNSGKKKRGNVISIKISPTKISIKTEKKYKEKTLKEIMDAFVGLRNSGGGLIKLYYDKNPPEKHVHDCIRKIEQRITDVTGSVLTIATDVQTNQSIPGQITLTVSSPTTSHLLTLNYHLYFPSDNQVILVPPTEQVDRIVSVLEGGTPAGVPTLPGSHVKHFKMDQKVDICESKTTQFKNVKAEKSKRVTIADRLETNKFRCYVSAFANYCGGHIYYGINEHGIVKGEKITLEDRDRIVGKVTKIIGKMTWPEHSAKRRGQQWEIHFVPVEDSKGIPIPSTFVIVIYFARCPGGVFAEEPESYHLVEGKLEKMNFTVWKRKVSHPECNIINVNDGKPITDRTSYRSVYQSLTKMLNNNCSWSELKQASESAEGSYDEVNVKLEVKLICLSKLVSYCYRRGDFSQAEDLLGKYRSVLSESKVSSVFEVLEQYLHCAMERSRGDNEKSYEIAKNCSKRVDEMPAAGIITAAFHVLAGTVVNNLATQEENSDRRSRLIEEARTFYTKTKEHLKSVQDFPSAKADIEHKMYTNLAMLNLGCSLSGNIAYEMNDFGDTKTAEDCLLETKRIELRDKYPFSDFREIQYDLAISCLLYRSSREEPSHHRQVELLIDALRFSKKAEQIAKDCNFQEMRRCSKKRTDFFQETLQQCEKKSKL